jgi:pyridoxine/pyridoxamine 5'-phosphate oxidase
MIPKAPSRDLAQRPDGRRGKAQETEGFCPATEGTQKNANRSLKAAVGTRPRPAHADDLHAVRTEAFALLARGVADRRSPFHTPTLASLGPDGAPRARTLVLRGFDAQSRTIRLHSDARSDKCAELARDPRCALHLYDAPHQVQLRLEGTATLHHDDAVADAAWEATRPFSRLIYAIQPAPGTPVAAPNSSPTQDAGARANFAILRLRFFRMEWLWLAAEGHRRARFTWNTAGTIEEATWLSP